MEDCHDRVGRRPKTPLYEQLYAALADEIRTGQRAPGTPLPGRRTMAAQQGVSVNTVDAAYQMLAAEGLAEPRPRSGFYVQKTYGMLHSRARHAPAAPAPQPPAAPQPVYDLSTGSVDTALFPARSWGRIQKELLYQRPELYSAARCRATPRCAHRLRNICRCTAVWNARRSRSSSARALSICSGAWRTCSATAWRPSRTPATSARGRSCRTAAFPARWWTLTARACPPTRWKKRRKPLLSDAQSSLSDGCYDARDPPRPAAGLGSGPARAVHFGGRLRLGVPL
ncbi:GntR family transcriptional regulator [Gemmiger formicilis]|nr:GntR family transcriptional regulator [Gemmiger formicilis]